MTSQKVPFLPNSPQAPQLDALVHDPRADQYHPLVRFTPRGPRRGTTTKPLMLRNQTFAEGDRAVIRLLANADYPVSASAAEQRRLVKAIEDQSTDRHRLLADQV